MTLKDEIDADASATFLNTDEFAESVTYVPYNYMGETVRANRSISAVVFRRGVEDIGREDVATAVSFEVHVRNDSTLGIASDELDLGGDQLSFPSRDGETATNKVIKHLITQDHAMLVLECR